VLEVSCDWPDRGMYLRPIDDARLDLQGWPEERWTWLDAGANGGRAIWRHKMADDTWRLDFQLGPDEDAEAAATPAAMRRRVQALVGVDAQFDIAWSGAWGYRHECLDDLRCGRVIFAGDAAHLVAPFGARGGNGGIQDADNLGWKLALHLQGHAGEALVDSYCSERRPAALENIRQARRSSRFVFPANHAAVVPWRNAIIALAPKHPLAARMINTGRLSAPCVYGESALVRGGHASAGAALPNVVLRRAGGASGATLHGLLGPWFTALVMAERVPERCAARDDPLLKWVAVAAHCDDAGRQRLARQLPLPSMKVLSMAMSQSQLDDLLERLSALTDCPVGEQRDRLARLVLLLAERVDDFALLCAAVDEAARVDGSELALAIP